MTNRKPLLIILAVGWLAALLVACTVAPVQPEDSEAAGPTTQQQLAEAAQLAQNGDLRGAAARYWKLAQATPRPRRQALQLQALETVLEPSTRMQAERYSARIDEATLTPAQRSRKHLADARLALMAEQPRQALSVLPQPQGPLAPKVRTQVLRLRARALAATGNILGSARARIMLAQRLNDVRAQRANRDALWSTLGSADARQLQQWLKQAADPNLHAWLELARIAQSSPPSVAELNSRLSNWRQRHPGHTGEAFVAMIRHNWQSLQFRPQQIALILPMTGDYAKLGQAIHAGVLAAHLQGDDTSYRPDIRLYDLGDQPYSIWSLYQRAQAEGADLIIGPLRKKALDLLADTDALPTPVLSLNYMDTDQPAPDNLYQFGLLPEDEASQVAERAILDQRDTAVVLVPRGEWGGRLYRAFAQRYQQLGGHVVTRERYDPDSNDFSAPIRKLLAIDASKQRHQQLEHTLRRNLLFDPHRRYDADMVFMAASPQQARLLRPQLEFYYAANLPTYATSHIFSGIENQRADRDIDGIIYCDMPWMLTPQQAAPGLRKQLELEFPDAIDQLPRFAALGVDAYRVIPYLKRLAANDRKHYRGVTGSLSMDKAGRIHRQLKWGHFVDGIPHVLGKGSTTPSLSAR